MFDRTQLLALVCLVCAPACGDTRGEVGAPCDTDADCSGALICDDHGGKSTCQEEHGHGDDDAEPAPSAGHDHTHVLDVTTWDKVPTLSFSATQDPHSGWTLEAQLEHFRLAPERASSKNVEGEGHLHLYVDGEKVTRLYGPWFHLNDLAPGAHELRLELTANDHSVLAVGGVIIDDTLAVEQLKPTDDHHESSDVIEVAPNAAPALRLTAHQDPKSGWNLELGFEAFKLAPQQASTAHVPGEGYVQLLVNGEPSARVYSDWYYLPQLAQGKHLVEAVLTTNDHRSYSVLGKPIRAKTTVTFE